MNIVKKILNIFKRTKVYDFDEHLNNILDSELGNDIKIKEIKSLFYSSLINEFDDNGLEIFIYDWAKSLGIDIKQRILNV